ncbi:MAG TPA: class I SAM-dependent methyltransferase, partial [Pseudonocardiaceae bacterium]|nr:class I SAM-dependent methyltransferase [Pseudonocardiaceae bacterium]
AALSDLGYRCDGLDVSATMIGAARRRYPHLTFRLGDQRELAATEPYDVVLSLGSALLHNKTLPDLRRTLRGFTRCLRPGALLVIELRNGGYWLSGPGQRDLAQEHHEVRALSTGGLLGTTVRYELDLRRQLLLRQYRWELPDGSEVREMLAQLLLLPGHLLDELMAVGLVPLASFSEPAPAHGDWNPAVWPREDQLCDPRLQVVARFGEVEER